ncbi:hexameric tyrosine-coordinated heme protein [Gilvimarinus sp. F26214L]|uniref:hexameric tyrosine-coordinated heme protein n=1 Tax=Gilvimarinus sp. DZF01 TaxID=3461371 RepID=UPI0040464FD8
MRKHLLILSLSSLLLALPGGAGAQTNDADQTPEPLNLMTDSPEEGFELAVELARRAVTRTQKDKDVLVVGRGKYSRDADALIAVSHVVAVHFQTVAAANNYWRD